MRRADYAASFVDDADAIAALASSPVIDDSKRLTHRRRRSLIVRRSHPLPICSEEPNPTQSRVRKHVLDKLEKTRDLVAALQAAAPFEIELTPEVIAQLRGQKIAIAVEPWQVVSRISYAGDEGGILCHIKPAGMENAIILSLTHVRVHRSLPFAADVFDYQKHSIKKLKKQKGQ